MKDKLSKDQLHKIITRIDSLNDEELFNEFIRLNANSRDEFKMVFLKSLKKSRSEIHDDISQSIHKLLLRKMPPISSMRPYLETVVALIHKTHSNLLHSFAKDREINLEKIITELTFLEKMVSTLILDIQKGYDVIIAVDFNNSKEHLLKEFEDFLSSELPKSVIHQCRKRVRSPNQEKLRKYLKVWKLKKEGLSFQDISASINEKTAAVKKQFRRAFEIIYGCKFSKEKYNELVIQLGDQPVCEKCPKRSKCTKPCEEIEKDLKSREKYQREKLGGDKSIEEMPEEFFDLLDDEIDNDDESDPKKYSLPDA